MKKKIIGITGSLATGKTLAADIFVSLGAERIDADRIAHSLLEEDEEVKTGLVEAFGEGILSGSEIDRKKLREAVFLDKEKLKKLSEVTHPVIIERIKKEAASSSKEVVVIDAPLLIEAGLHDYVDIVVVISSSEETQIKRALERGLTEEEARRIIKNQMPLDEKKKFADYVIDNDEEKEKVKEGVKKIWQKK